MKKLVITLLVLVIIVAGSPAVIGGVAEKAVQDNLDWAAGRAGEDELKLSVESFEKGWFSSNSRYRVEVGDGELKTMMMQSSGLTDTGQLPQLLVDTRLDHGILPFSTMKPGLGSAVSTLSLVDTDGNVVDIPGAVYSDIGLTGYIDSVYELDAGSSDVGDAAFGWQDVRIAFGASPATGYVMLDAATAGFNVDGAGDTFSFDNVAIEVEQEPSEHGFYVGSSSLSIDRIEGTGATGQTISMAPFSVVANSVANGELIDADTQVAFKMTGFPMVGDVGFDLDLAISGVDGVAAKNIGDVLGSVDDSLPPEALYPILEADLKQLFEKGFSLDVRELDIEMSQGRTDTSLLLTVPAMPAGFTWPDALRAMTAEAKMSVPVPLMDLVVAMTPQANMAIAMGWLQRDDENDVYVMDAQYAQGLMTINGTPMPLPIPGN